MLAIQPGTVGATQPSAVGAAQPVFAFDAPGLVVIEPSEPGNPLHVLYPFVPQIAVALLLNWLNKSGIPSHVLWLFVLYAIIALLLNAPDIPSLFVLHIAIAIQPDVLHVATLPLHIFPAVP